jgi:hypothetical protein
VYSWLMRDWVFVVTNTAMLVSAIAGAIIVRKHQRRAQGAAGGEAPRAQAASRPR